MKNLIIHGNKKSGKSLFIKNLLRQFRFSALHCRGLNLEKTISWGLSPEHRYCKILWFQDIPMRISEERFFLLANEFKVDIQYHEPILINPFLILEFEGEIKFPTTNPSFTSRFHFINTNTISYKDLMGYFENLKIEIRKS